jgi:hypothetical protein
MKEGGKRDIADFDFPLNFEPGTLNSEPETLIYHL